MLGDSGPEDTELLDNLITEAVLRVYKRAAIRPSNPIPVFSDLRDELAQWRDEDKNQQVMDMAQLAAIKLRSWAGEKGQYAKLFDRPTTIKLDCPWLFFNVEQLKDDPRLEAAMSLLVAYTTSQRAAGKAGRRSITVLDEFWYMLSSSVLAPVMAQLYRTARKRNAGIWGIGQSPEEVVGTGDQPTVHGAGIIKNCSTKIIGQQPGDTTALRDHLHLNETALNQIKRFSAPLKGRSADALIVIGERAETTHTIRISSTPADYWIMTTYPRERLYRAWWLEQHKDLPLIARYQELGDVFPLGLADLEPLPEELSGEVAAIGGKRL
jgi:TraG P-loop domain